MFSTLVWFELKFTLQRWVVKLACCVHAGCHRPSFEGFCGARARSIYVWLNYTWSLKLVVDGGYAWLHKTVVNIDFKIGCTRRI